MLDDKTVKMRAMPMIMIVSSLSLKGGDRIKEEHITEWQKKNGYGTELEMWW